MHKGAIKPINRHYILFENRTTEDPGSIHLLISDILVKTF